MAFGVPHTRLGNDYVGECGRGCGLCGLALLRLRDAWGCAKLGLGRLSPVLDGVLDSPLAKGTDLSADSLRVHRHKGVPCDLGLNTALVNIGLMFARVLRLLAEDNALRRVGNRTLRNRFRPLACGSWAPLLLEGVHDVKRAHELLAASNPVIVMRHITALFPLANLSGCVICVVQLARADWEKVPP